VFSVEGNFFKAEPGLCEVDSGSFDPEGKGYDNLQLLPSIFSGVIKTDYISANSIPLTTWIRSLFFQELDKLSSISPYSLVEVLSALKGSDWSYASSEVSWSRFLQTRYSTWPSLEGDDDMILRFGPQQNSWDIASWKQAKLKILQEKTVDDGFVWNHASISQHLAIYCGLITLLLLKEKKISSPSQASLLCASALGFPHIFGDPLSFADIRGERRMCSYARDFWPSIHQYLYK
jgi:hypothetical protein